MDDIIALLRVRLLDLNSSVKFDRDIIGEQTGSIGNN